MQSSFSTRRHVHHQIQLHFWLKFLIISCTYSCDEWDPQKEFNHAHPSHKENFTLPQQIGKFIHKGTGHGFKHTKLKKKQKRRITEIFRYFFLSGTPN